LGIYEIFNKIFKVLAFILHSKMFSAVCADLSS
jgi:hypothetical protein